MSNARYGLRVNRSQIKDVLRRQKDDLVINIPYSVGSDYVEITVIEESEGTFNTLETTLTVTDILLNTISTYLPLTLIEGDVLKIEYDSPLVGGSIKLVR